MRTVMSAVMALAAIVAFVAVGSDSKPVQAAPVELRLTATGAEEVPPVPGTATVNVRLIYDGDTKTLQYAATVSGLSANLVTAAHIHRGARGVNGPIVHNLSETGFTQVAGTINLSDADIRDLEAGNFYFNAHSTANPAGFARAQIILPAAAPAASPTTAPAPAVRPPSTGDAGLAGQISSHNGLLLIGAFMLGGGALIAVRRRV
jgi:hypothetical protein